MQTAIELRNSADLDKALKLSNEKPVLFFKHSLTCPISARAYRQFESFLENAGPEALYGLIIIQESRPVSNEVAERLGIQHQSPQALLVQDGRVTWDASHFDITVDSLSQAVASAK